MSLDLKSKIKVATEIAFTKLLIELGYREGEWKNDEEEKYNKLIKLSDKYSDDILNLIQKNK